MLPLSFVATLPMPPLRLPPVVNLTQPISTTPLSCNAIAECLCCFVIVSVCVGCVVCRGRGRGKGRERARAWGFFTQNGITFPFWKGVGINNRNTILFCKFSNINGGEKIKTQRKHNFVVHLHNKIIFSLCFIFFTPFA